MSKVQVCQGWFIGTAGCDPSAAEAKDAAENTAITDPSNRDINTYVMQHCYNNITYLHMVIFDNITFPFPFTLVSRESRLPANPPHTKL